MRSSRAALTAASLIIMSACSSSPPPPEPSPLVTVQTTRATLSTISQVITAGGNLFPLQQASISPKISAPVRTFYAKRGDYVKRGQLLAVLENQDLAAAVVSAEGTFDTANANFKKTTATTFPEQLQAAELNLESATASLKAQQKFYDSNLWLFEQHAGARKQVDQAEVALTAARTQYELAKKHLENLQKSGKAELTDAAGGQLEAARGQLQSAKAQLGYSELRSPIDGSVADRSVYQGDVAIAGTPLIIVMDVSKVVLKLHLPQQKAAVLKLGDLATLHIPGFQNGIPGKITVVSPALDPNSTTVEFWIEAPNPNNTLQPGTSVEVSITARVVPNALVVPSSCLLNAADGSRSVMVVKSDGRAYRQKVTTGIEDKGKVEILSGLTAGEEIISTGAYGLPDNTKVKTMPASSSALPGPPA